MRVVRSFVDVPFGGVLDGAVDERAHVRVGQRVEDVLAGAAPRDDALGAEQAQLLRDGGEADALTLSQVTGTIPTRGQAHKA